MVGVPSEAWESLRFNLRPLTGREALDDFRSQWHTCNAHMAGTQRAHILIPGDLLQEIDALVGPRGRSAFLLQTAREELQRRKLLRFLESDDPAWEVNGHPELARGAAAWVQQLRKQGEKRLPSSKGLRQTKSRRSKSR